MPPNPASTWRHSSRRTWSFVISSARRLSSSGTASRTTSEFSTSPWVLHDFAVFEFFLLALILVWYLLQHCVKVFAFKSIVAYQVIVFTSICTPFSGKSYNLVLKLSVLVISTLCWIWFISILLSYAAQSYLHTFIPLPYIFITLLYVCHTSLNRL